MSENDLVEVFFLYNLGAYVIHFLPHFFENVK
jgi:hypothetical protein